MKIIKNQIIEMCNDAYCVRIWFSYGVKYITFSEGNNGFIMVTANGGINQQRVAVSYIYIYIFYVFLFNYIFK